jgi:hypothetical protein
MALSKLGDRTEPFKLTVNQDDDSIQQYKHTLADIGLRMIKYTMLSSMGLNKLFKDRFDEIKEVSIYVNRN